MHGRGEILLRGERDVGDRRRMIDEANRPVFDRQHRVDRGQPAVDLFAEDVHGPAGNADGVDVGFAFAVRRELGGFGLQKLRLCLYDLAEIENLRLRRRLGQPRRPGCPE